MPDVPFVDLSWQNQPLRAQMTQVINQVIDQGDFVLGAALATFEQNFAQACGVRYGVGVASGTSAIALGLQACGIGKGDDVLVPVNTFIATAIGVIQAGATPIFVDCDPQTALIDLELAAKAITPQTKAIIPVHLYGQMVLPSQLQDLADRFNLIVLEDAAQAHLAQREGYRAGSVGRLAAFSFYPSKNLGALGNGGMVVTNDEVIAQKVRSLRNYGAPQKYYHLELGTNSRLDTLQAAVLDLKLSHLEAWNDLRYRAAQAYDTGLAPLHGDRLHLLTNHAAQGHVYHLYVIQLADAIAPHRLQLQNQLQAVGIQTGIHYPIPCHQQPACQCLGWGDRAFPSAESLCQGILSLPLYPGIQTTQIEWVIENLTHLLANF
jgi:dTDP-4-amino-4,6-dideoxygalactose transaminase